jgi:hypothetical protein
MISQRNNGVMENNKTNQGGEKIPDNQSTHKTNQDYNYQKPNPDFPDFKERAPETEDALDDSDLDIPGAELDDKEENIGSEDEENNYYSIGGDEHNDLEETQSDTTDKK